MVKKSDTEYALVPIEQTPPQPEKQNAAAANPAPKPGQSVTAVRYHVVKKNENLSSIAKRYAVPLQELCRQNNLAPAAKVAAGTKLKIVKQKPLQ
jgi:LysM repeat protein